MGAVDVTSVGQVFTGTPPFEVSRRAVAAFADAVGATSALHRDPDAARAAGFADVVAPVTFAVVIAQEAEAEYISDPASGVDFSRVVHADENFTYARPLVAGETVHTAVHIAAITARGGLTLVTTRTEITDSAGVGLASVVSTLAVRGEDK